MTHVLDASMHHSVHVEVHLGGSTGGKLHDRLKTMREKRKKKARLWLVGGIRPKLHRTQEDWGKGLRTSKTLMKQYCCTRHEDNDSVHQVAVLSAVTTPSASDALTLGRAEYDTCIAQKQGTAK